MPELTLFDRLDQALESLLTGSGEIADPQVAPLLALSRDLRDLPRDSFRARLRSDLERRTTMATTSPAVPRVAQTATARLRIKNADAAIEFYKKAFGAREIMRFVAQNQIAHAEIEIGNSVIMVGEAAPEYGFPGPEALGGSPMSVHLLVDDVDALAAQAVAAGARIVRPVQDQFYGDRSGMVADPFGYIWNIATRKEEMPLDEMYRRFEALTQGREEAPPATSDRQTLTPYLVAQDAPGLIEFLQDAFGAEIGSRTVGTAGGVHAEVRLGDSRLMIGGGAPDLAWRGESRPAVLHAYFEDVDAVYRRALLAGAESTGEPVDQPYGERGGGVKDRFGNHWYIATCLGERFVPEGCPTVMPYLHPLRAEPVIRFLKQAFDGVEIMRHASPDGVIHHAAVKIGNSMIEMGEAHGPYQPVPAMFYLYVPDVDAAYVRAMVAGASSVSEPADQPYGDRRAGLKDAFGNEWYIATRIRAS